MVWQLSISHGALSSLATDNAMSLTFPIEISRDLVAASSQYSQPAMEVHGIGLVSRSYNTSDDPAKRPSTFTELAQHSELLSLLYECNELTC